MANRSQYNHDKIRALTKTLVRAELITEAEAQEIAFNRELNVHEEISGDSAYRSVIASKIDDETKEQRKKAKEEGDMQKQLDIIWSILTGE
jgi:hypothetical protein